MAFDWNQPFHPEGRPEDVLRHTQDSVSGGCKFTVWERPTGVLYIIISNLRGEGTMGPYPNLINSLPPLDWTRPLRFRNQPDVAILAGPKRGDGVRHAAWFEGGETWWGVFRECDGEDMDGESKYQLENYDP